jgi:hemerythrin-like domain-containing protein
MSNSGGRIEVSIEEYQGMRKKIKDLESALNSVSQEAAVNKEIIEKAKAFVVDIEDETFVNRLFRWKSVVKPLNELFNGKIQEASKEE